MTDPYDSIEAWISHRGQTRDDVLKAGKLLDAHRPKQEPDLWALTIHGNPLSFTRDKTVAEEMKSFGAIGIIPCIELKEAP